MQSNKSNHSHFLNTHHKRRGSLYVSVMGVTLIVAMIGLSALLAARVHMKEAVNGTAKDEAQQLAYSAIEYAISAIQNDSGWRTTYTQDTEITPFPLGNGTASFKLYDDDGNLSGDPTDSALLIGIGRVGDIVYSESVLLMPTGSGLSCLETAFHCHNFVSLGMLVRLETDQTISSNASIYANNPFCGLYGDAEASGGISGYVTGTKTVGVPQKVLPGSGVFDYYTRVGTWIDVALLPVDGSGDPIIQKTTISPHINPFGGPTNLEGIYVIDCQGETLTISNSRIEGTIVILNPGSGTAIKNSMHWKAAVNNFPALLTNGDIQFRTSSTELKESTLSTNFNPAGFPFEGNTDSDISDTYSSEIFGLIYTSAQILFPFGAYQTKITGAVVSNSSYMGSGLEVNYFDTYLNYPPPGFAAGPEMAVIPGTRRREP